MQYRDVFLDFIGDAALFERCCRDACVDDPGPRSLSGAERLAVWLYSSADPQWAARINDALWDGKSDETIRAVEILLNAALQKLKPVRGLVCRGFQEPDLDDLLPEYAVGVQVRWFEFASAAIDPAAAGEGNVLFVVSSRTARLLGAYAEDPDAGEVVFPSGSVFRVRAVERRQEAAVIELEEVTA